MKNIFLLFAVFVISAVFVGKVEAYEPWGIGLYSEITEPQDFSVPGAVIGQKTGEATCKTVLGIINWGDCSVKTAMKNGKISKVTAADWAKKYIIVYGEKTLRVYGN